MSFRLNRVPIGHGLVFRITILNGTRNLAKPLIYNQQDDNIVTDGLRFHYALPKPKQVLQTKLSEQMYRLIQHLIVAKLTKTGDFIEMSRALIFIKNRESNGRRRISDTNV